MITFNFLTYCVHNIIWSFYVFFSLFSLYVVERSYTCQTFLSFDITAVSDVQTCPGQRIHLLHALGCEIIERRTLSAAKRLAIVAECWFVSSRFLFKSSTQTQNHSLFKGKLISSCLPWGNFPYSPLPVSPLAGWLAGLLSSTKASRGVNQAEISCRSPEPVAIFLSRDVTMARGAVWRPLARLFLPSPLAYSPLISTSLEAATRRYPACKLPASRSPVLDVEKMAHKFDSKKRTRS